MDKSTRDYLHRQLVKLGDMMGDGLHHEPDGKWIAKEYNRVAKALGYIKPKPRRNDSKAINKMMSTRVKNIKCKCGGTLKQTRSGSMRAVCTSCKSKFQLLKRSSK
ncbi:hypothetical protein [Catenovulum sediminis]|uniref:Uncharacterized protein n=1 Tax=Catenovulum sediminis TaxID=1740262 RepID=A0ABV1RHK6_9ALTE